MAKPTRTFNANIGDPSTGIAGPDYIEADLDAGFKMFDPLQPGGGIGTENIQNGAATDDIIGNRTVNPTLAGGNNTGTLTQLLSWIAKLIKAISGKTNWYDTPVKSIEQLNTDLQNFVLGQIPDESITTAKLSPEAVTDVKLADSAKTVVRVDSTKELRVEVVSAYPAHAPGRFIFHTGEGEFKGSNGTAWL